MSRNFKGYSLIETMTVIAVLAIVAGLLYAYSDQGWRLFYQSYGRGLSQVKAKLAIRLISEELREANKNRTLITRGSLPGVPIPDDIKDSSPYIYFTKPRFYEPMNDVIAYDYVLYYFAKPKEKNEPPPRNNKKRIQDDNFLTLRSIKFINQSKHYTEDEEKKWPFLPPILEINKSSLPEDEDYIQTTSSSSGNSQVEEEFLDHFTKLKKYQKNVPISGNFITSSLTDSFSSETASITFFQDYKNDNPIKIKVSLQESPFLFGLTRAMSDFEVKITPRN